MWDSARLNSWSTPFSFLCKWRAAGSWLTFLCRWLLSHIWRQWCQWNRNAPVWTFNSFVIGLLITSNAFIFERMKQNRYFLVEKYALAVDNWTLLEVILRINYTLSWHILAVLLMKACLVNQLLPKSSVKPMANLRSLKERQFSQFVPSQKLFFPF